MKKPELLAPVGNKEALVAAIHGGCDAVYIGGYMFGARSFAGNFSNEEIVEVIKYAHLYGVKVYVTVNTLVYENEVDMFLDYVDFLHKNNVDAVIVQDIGMMDLVRQTFPNLTVHASTQMHIHNLEGVKLLEEIGVKRVVLARESPISLIKEIKEKTNVELEIFIHGALCISYSGQCLFSSLIGGRSGNRGTCAQSCRQKYSLVELNNNKYNKLNKDEYLLSTKDLNTIYELPYLIDMGVNSLKIEGRMKRPEYVYLIVSLYRKAIDSYIETGKIDIKENDILEMKKIFNRQFTKGFIFGEENNNYVYQYRPNHIGVEIGKVSYNNNGFIKIKLTEELRHGDGIRILNDIEDIGFNVNVMKINGKLVKEAFKGDEVEIKFEGKNLLNNIVIKTTDIKQSDNIKKLIKENSRKVLLTGEIAIKLDKQIILEISDGENKVVKTNDYVVTKSINNETTIEDIKSKINKLGDTHYQFAELEVDLDNNLFVPVSVLNDLRRNAIDELNKKRLYNIPYQKGTYSKNVPNYDINKNYNILINTTQQYNLIRHLSLNNIYVKENIYEELSSDKRVVKKLERVIEHHQDLNVPLLVGELGSVNKYKNVYTDFSLNVTNSYTAAFLHNLGVKIVTLSYELNKDQISDLVKAYKERYQKHPNLELIVYGYEEVMISKYNMLKHYQASDNAYLQDRFNNLYKLTVYNDLMKIYHYKPRMINDIEEYFKLGINHFRLNLLNEINIEEILKNIIV